jgi:hypothetical protein
MHKRGEAAILATHYAPCVEKTTRLGHVLHPWSYAFATEIIWSMGRMESKYGVYGHTHFCNDFKVNDIRVVGNQRGYVFQTKELCWQSLREIDVRRTLRI